MSLGIMTLGNSRVRLAASAIFMMGLLICAFVRSPPVSRARPAVLQNTTSPDQKRPRAKFIPGHVLVRYQDEATAKRQQRSIRSLRLGDRTIPIEIERFGGSDMIAGLRLAHVAEEDTMSAIQALRAQPDVLYAEPDLMMHATITPNDPCFPANALAACQSTSLYAMTKIGATTVWNIPQTGSSSVVVGVIDQGTDISHVDLQSNVFNNPHTGSFPPITGDLHGYNFFDNNGTVYSGNPAEYHGTHVSGTIGAVGNNGLGVVGVNWAVKLMPLKFLDANGNGSTSDAIRACTYAKQMRDLWVSSGGTQGANLRVLNNSWGPDRSFSNGFSEALRDVINSLNSSGILFVVAAGNDGLNNDVDPGYPAAFNLPNMISVAATSQVDALPAFSDFGAQTITMGAPGTGILSTMPNNAYGVQGGTSMAAPHVSGAAALLLAQNPNLTIQQLRSLLIFNGDPAAALDGTTFTGRRLNVANSFQALAENDVTAPGTPTNFHINTQSGRSLNVGWTTSGDDGATGQASLYQVTFVDANTGAVKTLKNLVPPVSGTVQSVDVKIPYGHTSGTFKIREIDNVGNEGTPASLNVVTSFAAGDPYASTVGKSAALSVFGTPLNFNCDDCYKTSALPFPFPFFGQNYNSVTVSSNGNLYFTPPTPATNDSLSGVFDLASFKMIAGLWDDLYLGTDQRADADVYVVQPDASRIIFRWQGVPCNANPGCTFGGAPINFEIELRSNGFIQTRYGSGNTSVFPVVGISGGDSDPYIIVQHTSESAPINLTNGQQVTYIPRSVMNPIDYIDFFVSQHYRDFLAREPDAGGDAFWIDQLLNCGGNQACLNTKRVDVSDAFFFEPEFQQTGSYVFRLYRAAFGNTQPFPNPDPTPGFPGEVNKLPLYTKFKTDRDIVVGGANLPQLQQDLANAFVQRAEFTNRYPANLTLDQFVTAILLQIKNDSGPNSDLTSLQSSLVALGSRGAVLYRLANDDLQGGNGGINNRLFIDAEYNRAFVYSLYAGYFRRDADIGGFLFWFGQVNSGPLRDPTKQHAMNCSQLTSLEYQFRFSTIATHGNNECQ